MSEFAAAVHAVVAALEPGQVVTYGEVAVEVGRPGAARGVGQVLAGSQGLPWWRVVTAAGRLVPGKEAEHAALLRAEGVAAAAGHLAR
ncbi:MAG: MGMT family protein [Euzebyales bacterium]|jgi:methylated-DNA-protein-cysteine methyltransferase-like protein|nr:MGMT family protein [Euzebyales bacterium]